MADEAEKKPTDLEDVRKAITNVHFTLLWVLIWQCILFLIIWNWYLSSPPADFHNNGDVIDAIRELRDVR